MPSHILSVIPIDLQYYIDPKLIEKVISPKTKAILPVHFAGRACDIDQITQLAKKYNLKIIEYCVHTIETEYHGQKAGTFGDFGCFNFCNSILASEISLL